METQNTELKVPILKKDSTISITLNYSQMGALVQSLFIIAGHWSEEKRNEFKEILEQKGQLKDAEQITYILIDQIYRNALNIAKAEDKIEMTGITRAPIN